ALPLPLLERLDDAGVGVPAPEREHVVPPRPLGVVLGDAQRGADETGVRRARAVDLHRVVARGEVEVEARRRGLGRVELIAVDGHPHRAGRALEAELVAALSRRRLLRLAARLGSALARVAVAARPGQLRD